MNLQQSPEGDKVKRIFRECFHMIVVPVLLALFCSKVLVVNATIPSGSMENTIQPGDRIIGCRLSYLYQKPKREDVIIFRFPDDETQVYIKRVIGLPGETVQIDEQGKIYINGEVLAEGYGREVIRAELIGLAREPIELGEDEYFVLGDNRNNSSDSRTEAVGNIKRSDIIGKAWLRVWPFSKFGILRHQ